MLILINVRGTPACLRFKGVKNVMILPLELSWRSNNQPFTEQQYCTLAEVTAAIMQTYPLITPDRIVGHCDISPGRRSIPVNISTGIITDKN